MTTRRAMTTRSKKTSFEKAVFLSRYQIIKTLRQDDWSQNNIKGNGKDNK
ncbi:hypothetical protein G210_0991, partial [Candida maltosa Xu316]